MSTHNRKSKVRLVGAFIIIAGALLVVAAGVALGMVYSQLKAEPITVAGLTPKGPVSPSAQPEADLLNAYAPAGMNPPNSKEVIALPDTPDSMMNGSFLRALFSIAAVGLGVALVVMGVGVMVAVVGIGPLRGSKKR